MIASIAPAAPNKCPVIDFVELTATSLYEYQNACLIANVSTLSLISVEVP